MRSASLRREGGMLRLSVEVRGALYLAAFVSVVSAIALAVRRLDPLIGVALPKSLVPFGAVLAIAGAILGLACVLLFVMAGRGTPVPLDPPRRFVAVGPYRYVRNPMYVGGLGILLGTGLALRSAAIVLLPPTPGRGRPGSASYASSENGVKSVFRS